MQARPNKSLYLLIGALNTFACSYYANYLFFLLARKHGFGNLENLAVSALHGFVFAFAAWQGGRFAQRYGYLTSLQTGFAIMGLSLLVGWFSGVLPVQLLVLITWTVGMCLTWPALEALVSVGEDEHSLPRRVGHYNITWSATAAGTYFIGGVLFDTLGAHSLFWLPLVFYAALWMLATWMKRQFAEPAHALPETSPAHPEGAPSHSPEAQALRQPIRPQVFLRMAWLANPFAYMGINTLLAMIPGLAKDLQLSTSESGLFCSLWFFARLGAFFVLWRWTGWHYRFRWLATGYLVMVAGLGALLLSRHIWLLVLAQLAFGLAVGLLYYSSLFYSMDVGENSQGEHGGLHEAMIGTGICVGPAIGALGLWLAPGSPHAGAYSVLALLGAGFLGLLRLRWRGTFKGAG